MGVIRFVVEEVYNIKFTKAEIERIILTLKQTNCKITDNFPQEINSMTKNESRKL